MFARALKSSSSEAAGSTSIVVPNRGWMFSYSWLTADFPN
jgi:hypothetical protein